MPRTQAEIANLRRVDPRTVRRWAAAGVDLQNDAAIDRHLAGQRARPAKASPVTQATTKPGGRGTNGEDFLPIRWTQRMVAAEFGVNERTVSKKLTDARTTPGPDNKYATKDVIDALYDDIQVVRKRLLNAQADRIEFDLKVADGSKIDEQDVREMDEQIYVAIRQTVIASHLNDFEQAALLAELRSDIKPPQDW
jgi:hypothetical protein